MGLRYLGVYKEFLVIYVGKVFKFRRVRFMTYTEVNHFLTRKLRRVSKCKIMFRENLEEIMNVELNKELQISFEEQTRLILENFKKGSRNVKRVLRMNNVGIEYLYVDYFKQSYPGEEGYE